MKITSLLACMIPACCALSATAATMTITSNPGTDVTVKFTLGASNVDAGPVNSSFTFATAKGLLGPSSNPTDQSGFANHGKDLFAITVEPATKAAFVHLFLAPAKGNLIFLNDVNTAVADLLPKRKSDAKEFLRVESIRGRKIRMETIDYSHAPFKTRSFGCQSIPMARLLSRTSKTHTVVRPEREAKVAPAAPAGTHHVMSPTIPSTDTPRSC